MPTCVHKFIRGPHKGEYCRVNSPLDKCWKHRELVEFKCEECDNMTTNVSKRCNQHQLRGKRLLEFKEKNSIPLSEVDMLQKISNILKEDKEKLIKVYNEICTPPTTIDMNSLYPIQVSEDKISSI